MIGSFVSLASIIRHERLRAAPSSEEDMLLSIAFFFFALYMFLLVTATRVAIAIAYPTRLDESGDVVPFGIVPTERCDLLRRLRRLRLLLVCVIIFLISVTPYIPFIALPLLPFPIAMVILFSIRIAELS